MPQAARLVAQVLVLVQVTGGGFPSAAVSVHNHRPPVAWAKVCLRICDAILTKFSEVACNVRAINSNLCCTVCCAHFRSLTTTCWSDTTCQLPAPFSNRSQASCPTCGGTCLQVRCRHITHAPTASNSVEIGPCWKVSQRAWQEEAPAVGAYGVL